MNFFLSFFFLPLSLITSPMCQTLQTLPSVPQDSIIVFTGDSGRISSGLELLHLGFAPRLLISGVHPETSMLDLKLANPASSSLFDCCIALDYVSRNTRDNVIESAHWLRQEGFDSVILVTSDYHMPRSLLEFRSYSPDLVVHPFCVGKTDEPSSITIVELAKYLITNLRLYLGTPEKN